MTDNGPGPDPLDDPLSEETRASQREGLAEARRHADRSGRGLLIVYTGDGKGKTTAALGLLLRASAQKMRIAMFQFMKASSGNWGEVRAARALGVEIVPLGGGFTWTSQDLAHDRALAEEGWATCRAALADADTDVVILDELTYCLTFGWLDTEQVLAVLRDRPFGQHVVVTGRDAPAALLDAADLVTEMREVKHPFHQGVMALKGLDF